MLRQLVSTLTIPATLGEALLRRTGWYARACELLYTDLAWAYDLAAWLVSGGRWDAWRRAALDEALTGASLIVELGPGTGHGLSYLTARGARAVGIEPSPQMLAQARRRAARALLVRGRSQQIPLRSGRAGAVVCTFPGPWIADPATWVEIERVLRPGGRAVVLASAVAGCIPAHWRQMPARPAFLPPELRGQWCIWQGPYGAALVLVAEKSAVCRPADSTNSTSSCERA
jgi:SAM-dependent methyltransferase